MVSFKTIDGSRYELPSGQVYQTVEIYGRIWVYFKAEGKEKYVNLDHIVCITEKPDDR